jgi:MoaA/NifB/PqqE/SkfB family radical SAM enzyme
VQLFRADGTTYIQAMLTGRCAAADDVMMAAVRLLEREPTPLAGVFGALRARGLAAPEEAVRRRLVTLAQVGVLVPAPDADRPLLFQDPTSGVPTVDQVELTNACPMTCLMCPRGRGKVTRPQGFMDAGLFRNIVDQVASAPRVKPFTMHNLGEPLLHPHVGDMVRYATSRGVETDLSTNLALLPLPRYLELAGAGLSRLVLPVDGVEPATMESIRGPAAKGTRALQNLADLLGWRREHPEGGPEIVLQMIRMGVNQGEWEAFQERYTRLGIPRVVAFIKELDAATQDPDGRLFVGRQRPFLCRAPWLSVVVLWDGRVVPCCYDENGAIILGDLRTESLREVWQGQPVADLRRALRDGTVGQGHLCDTCPHRPDRYQRPSLDDVRDEPLHW